MTLFNQIKGEPLANPSTFRARFKLQACLNTTCSNKPKSDPPTRESQSKTLKAW